MTKEELCSLTTEQLDGMTEEQLDMVANQVIELLKEDEKNSFRKKSEKDLKFLGREV